MNNDETKQCVVFGAGALGLGFLGPELTPWYKLVYIDIKEKSNILSQLSEKGYYYFNEKGPAGRVMKVENVSGVLAERTEEVKTAVRQADLVFTAVGEANLNKIAPLFADIILEPDRDQPLKILCCENGLEIAAKLRQHIVDITGTEPGKALMTGDTIMGRMCQIMSPVSEGNKPVGPGIDMEVIGEPYYGIPAPVDILDGVSFNLDPFKPMTPDELAAHEDVKLLAHNGLHTFLSFLGWERGHEDYFCELTSDIRLMEIAHKLLYEEVAPALLSKHQGNLDRNYLMNYLPTIIRRITCPGLHDRLDRGRRDVMRKLQQWERLVVSIRAIHKEGITPRLYVKGLSVAINFAIENSICDLTFEKILTSVCGFDPANEKELIEFALEQRMK